jgi:hypothetical protein
VLCVCSFVSTYNILFLAADFPFNSPVLNANMKLSNSIAESSSLCAIVCRRKDGKEDIHVYLCFCVCLHENLLSLFHVPAKCVSNMCKALMSMCGLHVRTCFCFVCVTSVARTRRLGELVWAANTNFSCLCVHSRMQAAKTNLLCLFACGER